MYWTPEWTEITSLLSFVLHTGWTEVRNVLDQPFKLVNSAVEMTNITEEFNDFMPISVLSYVKRVPVMGGIESVKEDWTELIEKGSAEVQSMCSLYYLEITKWVKISFL